MISPYKCDRVWPKESYASNSYILFFHDLTYSIIFTIISDEHIQKCYPAHVSVMQNGPEYFWQFWTAMGVNAQIWTAMGIYYDIVVFIGYIAVPAAG